MVPYDPAVEASYGPGHWATWPPAFAPAAALLALLDRASPALTVIVWQLLAAASLGAVLAACARWRHGRRLSLSPGEGRIPLASLPMLVALFVPFRLVLSNFEHTQANLLILALAVGAFRLFGAGRRAAGGAALGLATAFKATPLLLLGYLAWRGRWVDLGAAVAGCLVFWAVLPAVLLGAGGTARWYEGWAGSVRAVEAGADVANQSALAVFERAVAAGGAVDPSGAALLLWIAVAIGLCAAGPLAFGRPLRPVGAEREGLELAAVLVATSLLSPIAWKAHFVTLVPLAASLHPAPGTLGAAFLALNLTATDVIGARAADALERYGIVTWVALFLLLVALVRLRGSPHEREGSGP